MDVVRVMAQERVNLTQEQISAVPCAADQEGHRGSDSVCASPAHSRTSRGADLQYIIEVLRTMSQDRVLQRTVEQHVDVALSQGRGAAVPVLFATPGAHCLPLVFRPLQRGRRLFSPRS